MGGLLSDRSGPGPADPWLRVYHRPGRRTTWRCAGALLRVRARGIRGQAHDHLAQVVAGEKAEEGLGRVLDALDHRLLPLHAPGLQPAAHLPYELAVAVEVVGDDEALHEGAVGD